MAQDALENLLKLDELALEVGYALVPLVDAKQGGQLLQRVKALRRHLALQLGFIVPPVHITDNLKLKPREYVLYCRGAEIARWELHDDCLLAVSSEADPPELPGVATTEPAFGVSARWIVPGLREQALANGYAVVDQTSVMATHMAELIKQHAHELLSRSETKRLLDRLSESHPKLTEELVPKLLSLGEVQKVLQQLLREQVSIRDLPTILESLLDVGAGSKQPVLLVEAARQALGRALTRPLLTDSGGLRVVTLDPAIEEELSRAYSGQPPTVNSTSLEPSFVRRILEELKRLAGEQVRLASPVLLCNTPARFYLRRLLEPFLPKVVVLSPGEIPPVVQLQSRGNHSLGGIMVVAAGIRANRRVGGRALPGASARTTTAGEIHCPAHSRAAAAACALRRSGARRNRGTDRCHAQIQRGKNVRFASYAKFRIRGAILDSLREMDWSPRDLRRKARRLQETMQKLQTELGRSATESELAQAMGVTLESFQHMLDEIRGLDVGSLQIESLEDGHETNLAEAIPGPPDRIRSPFVYKPNARSTWPPQSRNCRSGSSRSWRSIIRKNSP